jgi:hypothetical protein
VLGGLSPHGDFLRVLRGDWEAPRGEEGLCLGFRVWGLGFRVWGLGFGIWERGLGGSSRRRRSVFRV